MRKEKIGVGLVGCGGFGSLRAEGIARSKRAKLVAVADLNKARAKRAAKSFGCDFHTSWEDL